MINYYKYDNKKLLAMKTVLKYIMLMKRFPDRFKGIH